ncbi:LptF/LptG family permease [Shimia haliotis]|uniref:Lipopolysaccharide export LptBFGC system, permease protein LptF n=1 Tax=Shimia haliotis TaxID=1280847 RepID=A0A1I4E9Y3_9RHOB|nr:LptF/LptG family permease [Shimia haliotis]SFL02083.1 Lipopolysaccharide export LptBFGC system, permease protein LptF [Shimia haliotis]
MTFRAYTGSAVRLIARSYLMTVGFVLFALVVIALSIDLTKTLDELRAKAEAANTPLWHILMPYASYRAVDVLTRLLGTACVIGGFLAVLWRHQRREDVVLATAGLSPSYHFTAILMVALVFGALQFSFQNWVRPVAVKAQVETQLGRYGQWFGSTEVGEHWIVGNDTAITASVNRGEGARLENVKIFEGLSAPTLTRVIRADRALPDPDATLWVLENVTLWTAESGFAPKRLDDLRLALPINAASLQWYGVHGFYLPNSAAREIATLTGTEAASDAQTTLAFRQLAFFLPGVLIFLGASLAQSGLSGRRLHPPRLMALAAVGYLTVVGVKSFWILGINGRVPPHLAAALPLAIAFGVACLLQLHHAGYLFRRKVGLQGRNA